MNLSFKTLALDQSCVNLPVSVTKGYHAAALSVFNSLGMIYFSHECSLIRRISPGWLRMKDKKGDSVLDFGNMKAHGNRGEYILPHIIPFTARFLHAAPGGSHSHVSTGLRPFIPSLRLSKGWRPVLLSLRVGALWLNISGTPCFL
jgi:hypothetical protein